MEGINPLNEPPPPPRGLSENPRKPAKILENTSLFGVKKTSVSPPKSSESADSCVVPVLVMEDKPLLKAKDSSNGGGGGKTASVAAEVEAAEAKKVRRGHSTRSRSRSPSKKRSKRRSSSRSPKMSLSPLSSSDVRTLIDIG